ncbi:MAG: SpoIIE family protein phosphatase [Actinomycetota bacterium]
MQTTGGRAGDGVAAARLLPPGGHLATLDRLTGLAERLLSTPQSPVAVQVSLLTDVQTVAGGTGLAAGVLGAQSPVADSLCSVTVAERAPLVVQDTRRDARVAQMSPVASGAVGAYAGVPLTVEGGDVVGALCAFGPASRSWTPQDVNLLEELAGAVVAQLELQALTDEFEASRVRWEMAIEAAEVGSFDVDLPSGRLDWDGQMQTLFGYPAGTVQSDVDEGFSRIHPSDRPALDLAVGAAIETCGAFRAEYRVLLPDGDQRWLSARGRALAGEGGGPAVRLLGAAQDVTEMHTAREQAARLVETMTTGFVAMDSEWRLTYVNRTAERIIGTAAAEVIGRELWELLPGLEDSDFGERYRHARQTGETVEFEAHYAHLGRWFEVRAVPDAGGLALYFLDVTARRDDRARAEAATARLELLSLVSAELVAAGLAVEDAVSRLAELVVPGLADWCVVSLIDDGQIRDVGSWHREAPLRPVVESYVLNRLEGRVDLGAVQRAWETGRPAVIVTRATDVVLPTLGSEVARTSLSQLAPESVVAVPMTARGQITGILALCRGADRPPMSDDEITTALEVANRAGLALDNARAYAEQRSLAEVLQRSLLTTPPEPDHCEITVRYVPAAQAASVGGDWFDAFLQPDGATILVIGDVMGHDTVAAAAMGQVRSLLRGIAWHSGAAPAEVLSGLDAAMQGLQVSTTATAVIARLEQSSDERDRGITRLRWSNAGHPPPMAINADGTVIALSGLGHDLLLGFDPLTERAESSVVLDRGSTVLLYTDGLVERRGQDLDEGLALLSDTLRELADLPLEELCDELLRRMLPAEADDDVALVAVRLHRQDQPRPPEAGPGRVPANVPDEP